MIPLSYSIRSLMRRPLTVSVTIVGLSLVVFVFAAVLMLNRGVRETLASSGSSANAIILRDGAHSESESAISRAQFRLVSAEPGVALGSDGQPLISGESILIANLARYDESGGANVSLRGISPKSLVIRDTVKITLGRVPNPGTLEIMIGKNMVGRYAGARMGDSIKMARRQWKVVGIFGAGGSAFESEIWADAEQLMAAFNREEYSTAVLRLKDKAALAELTTRLAANPQLSSAKPQREDLFFESTSNELRSFFTILGTFVAIIFAVAAALGAAVTLNAQVSERLREIGALRAIGFNRRTVLLVFLRESILLSLVSAFIGTIAASVLSLFTFSTMNWTSFTIVTFHFGFGSEVLVGALAFSLVMGIVGGFSPALNAARLPIVTAMRGAT